MVKYKQGDLLVTRSEGVNQYGLIIKVLDDNNYRVCNLIIGNMYKNIVSFVGMRKCFSFNIDNDSMFILVSESEEKQEVLRLINTIQNMRFKN